MNQQQHPVRSKYHLVLEHFENAQEELSEAMRIMAEIAFDIQKGVDWIGRQKDNLVNAVAAFKEPDQPQQVTDQTSSVDLEKGIQEAVENNVAPLHQMKKKEKL